ETVPRHAGSTSENKPPDSSLLDFHQTRIERSAGADLGQLLRGEDVHVHALWIELGPIETSGDYPVLGGTIDSGLQLNASTIIEYSNLVALMDVACGGVMSADLEQ